MSPGRRLRLADHLRQLTLPGRKDRGFFGVVRTDTGQAGRLRLEDAG
jgi:hypothetical protein